MPDAHPTRSHAEIRRERLALLKRLAELTAEDEARRVAVLAAYDAGMSQQEIRRKYGGSDRALRCFLCRHGRNEETRQRAGKKRPELARQIAMEVR